MRKKWKITFLSLFVLAAAVLYAIWAGQAVEVQVKEVVPETIKRQLTEEGVVKAEVEYSVHPRFSGRIDSIHVEEGERVEAGRLLLTLDKRELLYEKARLQAELKQLAGEELKLTEQPRPAEIAEHKLAIKQAQARLEAADREYQRRKELYKQGAITEEKYHHSRDRRIEEEYIFRRREESLDVLREAYDPPPGSHQVINARKTAVQAQLDSLAYRLGEFEIHSPIAGVVGRLEPEEKELADPRSRLMTIFQDDQLLVEVDVLTRYIGELAAGMEAKLTFMFNEEDVVTGGKIKRIAPQAELDLSPLGLKERRVKVTIAPDQFTEFRPGPGYEVDVTFILERKTDQLTVPNRAVFTERGEDAVFVIEEGRIRLRRVETGISSYREIAITAGLKPGELVILNPRADGVRPGARAISLK